MLEFFETYGADILAILVALSGAITALITTIKSVRLKTDVRLTQSETMQKIQITQDGIVEAFKKAKIPTEWKISISNQVDKKLEAWAEKFLIMFKEHEDLRTKLALANTQILAYTAAFNKLTDEQKEQLNELLREVSEKDKMVEV